MTDVASYHVHVVAKGRLGVLVVVAIGAAVLVGLSAASTAGKRDSAKPGKASTSANGVTSSPGAQQQSVDDVARYWTQERMQDAKPAVRNVPGGKPAAPSAPPLAGVPSKTPARSAPAQKAKPTKRKTAAKADTPVASSPYTSGNAAGYWTQDAMDDAQPLGPTVDGGGEGSGGSSDPPISGVGVP